MPSQLSSLLVRDGLTTPRRIERALMEQVVAGGSLDTILLEFGEVPEDRLTQYLSLATGLPPASKTETDIFDAEAIKYCPEELANSYRVAPLALSDNVLKVLVCEPVNQKGLQELADEIGMGLQPVIAPEYRYHVIFGRIYGRTPKARYIDLAERQHGVTFAATGGAEPIILETHKGGESSKIIVDTPLQRHAKQDETDKVTRAEPEPPAPEPEAQAELTPVGPAPMELKDAREALGKSEDRDEIFELLLRGLRSVTNYAALLTVQGKSAIGRLAIHDGSFAGDDISSVLIPLDTDSAYKSTFSSGSPFIGPLASGDADIDSMTKRMGGEMPASGLILPIALRGRIVALAVGHCGDHNKWIGRASMAFTLASDTANAIQRLLAAKAQAKSGAVPAATDDDDKTVPVEVDKPEAQGKGKRKKRSKKANVSP
jgi:hypothetical protein